MPFFTLWELFEPCIVVCTSYALMVILDDPSFDGAIKSFLPIEASAAETRQMLKIMLMPLGYFLAVLVHGLSSSAPPPLSVRAKAEADAAGCAGDQDALVPQSGALDHAFGSGECARKGRELDIRKRAFDP